MEEKFVTSKRTSFDTIPTASNTHNKKQKNNEIEKTKPRIARGLVCNDSASSLGKRARRADTNKTAAQTDLQTPSAHRSEPQASSNTIARVASNRFSHHFTVLAAKKTKNLSRYVAETAFVDLL
jgi:3-phenylpropionate/cinnamic acid dioxygenase small subunit